MEQKKRKTGLGVDVFFPPPPEGAEVVAPTQPATEEPATAMATSPKVARGAVELGSVPTKPSARKPARRIRAEEKPRSRKVSEAATVKLTVMIGQDQFDQLEELKRRERQRLRKIREKGKPWRKDVTITHFVNQALTDFLAKRRL